LPGRRLAAAMPFGSPTLAVKQVTDTKWELMEDLVYEGRDETFVVDKGFRTDFASVPGFLTWLVPRYGRYTRAAILHDHLCKRSQEGTFDRHHADGIFRRAMRELGVSFLRRWLMWIAVRFGAGWGSFWRAGVLQGLAVALVGLLLVAFLAIPTLLVVAWIVAFWVLEWVVFAPLSMLSRRKAVNRPRLVR
jgi:hypothetical protein